MPSGSPTPARHGTLRGAAIARRLDPTSLRLFRAAVEERSLAAAAEREAIALSAASRRIVELEERLGAALLRRHDRGVTPTAAGEALMTHLAALFDLLDRIGADMDSFAAGERGHVRLHANMSAVSGFLPEALAGFLPAHPGIRLTLEERYSADILRAVASGAADLGLVSGTLPAEGLHVIPWREDRLVVVLPEGHGLLGRETLALADLDGVPFVGQSEETALQKLYRARAAAGAVALNVRVSVSGFDGVRRMVEAGLGLAILPATAAQSYAAAMRIRLRPLAEAWAARPLVIVTRAPDTLSAAARVLIAHLTRPSG